MTNLWIILHEKKDKFRNKFRKSLSYSSVLFSYSSNTKRPTIADFLSGEKNLDPLNKNWASFSNWLIVPSGSWVITGEGIIRTSTESVLGSSNNSSYSPESIIDLPNSRSCSVEISYSSKFTKEVDESTEIGNDEADSDNRIKYLSEDPSVSIHLDEWDLSSAIMCSISKFLSWEDEDRSAMIIN